MEQFAFQQPLSNAGVLCIDDNKLFQTRVPAIQNAQSPIVVHRDIDGHVRNIKHYRQMHTAV